MFRTIRRLLDLAASYSRYRKNRGTRSEQGVVLTTSIPVAHIIHLESRPDRAKQFREQFGRVGLNHVVFEATENQNGALGCALSHRRLLETTDPHEATWVCEDDIGFDVSGVELTKIVTSFLRDSGLDVLVLAHKTRGPTLPVSAEFAVTVSSQTTASYIVKPSARAAIFASFDQSALMLGLGIPPEVAAIDIHWQSLQAAQLVFCVPRMLVAHQVASYSDVQRREVDYYGDI